MPKTPALVSTEWLEENLADPNLRILDTTTFLQHPRDGGGSRVWSGRGAYEQGHIPGAVYADLLHELSDPNSEYNFTHPSRDHFVERVTDLGVGEGTHVILYDTEANVGSAIVASDWASRLWWQLRYEGFDQVSILDGGFRKWRVEGRPISIEPSNYPKGTFKGERRPELFVSKEEVKEAMSDSSVVIMNCLSPADHYGESNTYGRRGHIPGSKNVFFGDFSNTETYLLKDKEKLKEIIEPSGALDPDKKVITYCGGGIAATWNAFILTLLGKENVSVYDGSKSEWVRDKDAPLETT